MITKRIFTFVVAIIIAAYGLAEEINPAAIFAKVSAAYKSLPTYEVEGTIARSDNSVVTSFSMKLKKPNLYLVLWSHKTGDRIRSSGALWSDGTQPYFYDNDLKTYTKMRDDVEAWACGSMGFTTATDTIAPYFLSTIGPSHLDRLKDTRLEKTERVGEEDCYVITGASATSKRETYWISKSKYLIMKSSLSCEMPEGSAEISDESIAIALKAMGKEVTKENTKDLRRTLLQSRKRRKGLDNELYSRISFPELTENDFKFTPPAGTILKESFDGPEKK